MFYGPRIPASCDTKIVVSPMHHLVRLLTSFLRTRAESSAVIQSKSLQLIRLANLDCHAAMLEARAAKRAIDDATEGLQQDHCPERPRLQPLP